MTSFTLCICATLWRNSLFSSRSLLTSSLFATLFASRTSIFDLRSFSAHYHHIYRMINLTQNSRNIRIFSRSSSRCWLSVASSLDIFFVIVNSFGNKIQGESHLLLKIYKLDSINCFFYEKKQHRNSLWMRVRKSTCAQDYCTHARQDFYKFYVLIEFWLFKREKYEWQRRKTICLSQSKWKSSYISLDPALFVEPGN